LNLSGREIMRAFRCATIVVSAVLCAVLFTGCETSDDANNNSSTADVDASDQGDTTGSSDGITVLSDADEDVAPLPDSAEADAGPPEPDRSIGPLAKISVCSEICENAMTNCAGEVPFPDVETCRELCEADLTDDPAHLTNWVCAQETCGADLCGLGDNGIETKLDPHPACIELCGLADACGGIPEFGLPPSEIGLCIGKCTGTFLADTVLDTKPDAPSFGEVMECINAALNDQCDMDAVLSCVGDDGSGSELPEPGSDEHLGFCKALCGPDGSMPEVGCPGESPLMTSYNSADICEEACMQGDVADSLKWWGCVHTLGCGDPAACGSVPSENSPACVGTCHGLFQTCEAGAQEMTDEFECANLCTGYEINAGPFKDGGEQCMLDAADADDSGTFCDEDGASGDAMGACLIEPSEACVELCGELAPCIAEPGSDSEQAMFDCALGCEIGALGDAEEVSVCVDAADGDCEASLACLGGPNPETVSASDLCAYACGMLDGDQDDPEDTGCEPDSPAKLEMPDFLKCMEGCTMTNDPGQAMATLGCLVLSDCGHTLGTVSHCIDYPIAVLPSCGPACETLGGLCAEEVPGGPYCPEFCSGVMMNLENLASTEDVAACMDAVDTCEDDGFGNMLMCHVEPPEHCEATCGALDTCGMDDDGGCMDSCAMGYFGQSVDDPFPTCVAQADGDCGTMGECWALVFPPDQDP
jgi:hypothetical protein